MSLWDDVKNNIAEWYNVTSVKTAELGRIGIKSYDKFGISREIERQFGELGSFVYAGLKEGREDLLEAQTVQDLVARIQGLETELREKDQEYDGHENYKILLTPPSKWVDSLSSTALMAAGMRSMRSVAVTPYSVWRDAARSPARPWR